MEANTLLGFLDDASRMQAFELYFKKLELTSTLDLDILKTCIQLRPSKNMQSNEKLCDLLLSRVPSEPQDADLHYNLAEVVLSDGQVANLLFRHKIYQALDSLFLDLSQINSNDKEAYDEQAVQRATSYLNLLRSSYWLPGNQNHVIEPESLSFVSRFISIPVLEEVAHNTISSLLSLLRNTKPIVVIPPSGELPSWLKLSEQRLAVLAGSIVDNSVWGQLCRLGRERFKTNASRIFRTWFQWITQAGNDKLTLDCLNQDIYWEKLQTGLLNGFADQRKYCIGIIRQSLLAAQNDISTSTIKFHVSVRQNYINSYELYSALFEIMVLDRYANQVQACLPELNKLLHSEVTAEMITTLLSAALHPMVQEGVRKIVGNWYINYITKNSGRTEGYIPFLLTGFIPWATSGDLFTSTLVSTRSTTHCMHGEALVDVIARFISEASGAGPSADPPSRSTRKALIIGIADFIIQARGKLFQSSILYLLEGAIKGLRASPENLPLQEPLSNTDLEKILYISRLPGLPEVASNLYCDYCYQLYELVTKGHNSPAVRGFEELRSRALSLENTTEDSPPESFSSLPSVHEILVRFRNPHKFFLGENFAPACKHLIGLFDKTKDAAIESPELFQILYACWEEADRREFSRAVSIHLPSLLFHSTCIRACIDQYDSLSGEPNDDSLQPLLAKALENLQRLSEGRPYILSTLATSLRKAVFLYPKILQILPIEDYLVRFVTNPPSTKIEFLFEVAAAEKLQQRHPSRTYFSYYGDREWHAYAAVIDLIQRFPNEQIDLARRIFDRLLEPWRDQKPGGPIISKWKNVFELQIMLILAEVCIPEAAADTYLEAFRHALVLEAWPRYRFLLEWIVARLYYHFPGKSSQILRDLEKLDDSSSTHIASLMKLAVLVAPYESEDFSSAFMTHLVPFSASPKVQIRHESNYAIPIVFDLALAKGWKSITENPGFVSLNAFIRGLDKFQSAPWTIRTLKLDAIADFNVVNIFQGQYLTIESPEKERVAYEDFVKLRHDDTSSNLNVPAESIPLGTPPIAIPITTKEPVSTVLSQKAAIPTPQPSSSPSFFQTKSGFDISSLHPPYGSPSTVFARPASVILIASLIDNPTNLGGLSRISESFGLEALYIDDLKKTAHKDFKATSVTSEKHFPILQLKIDGIPAFIMDRKKEGYEVVGIEQTDRSGILGDDGISEESGDVVVDMKSKDLGTLPKKCVLVLGSEKGGISAEVLAVLDRCVEIRTVGVTRSLNVQTAGGIAVYEWWREWGGQL